MKFQQILISGLATAIYSSFPASGAAALTCGLSFQEKGQYIVVEAVAQNSSAISVVYSMRVTVRSGGNSSQSVQGGQVDISEPGENTVLSRSIFGGIGETTVSADLTVQSGEYHARCQADSGIE